MRYHIMESNDIRMNLATEEYLMNHADISEPLFLVYIQSPCVIIGRNQNAYEELDLNYLRENHITLTRRISGGGAVFDDLGNMSFSFVKKRDEVQFGDYQNVTEPILSALHKMGATQAQSGGRNDLYINGLKFSGNAMYSKNNRTYSHGTLMYDVDLSVLDRILTVSKEKIASKATPSVKKNVTNVKGYLKPEYQFERTEDFRDQLLCELYGVKSLTEIKDKELALTQADREAIQKLFDEKYANDAWIFGEAPAFEYNKRTRIASVGIVDVKLNVVHGKISAAKIFGDFFGQQPVEQLSDFLVGKEYRFEAIEKALKQIKVSEYIHNLTNEDFLSLAF
ncbi:lipoate--protein ligase [Enterococcus cecorum]|nr:lipoate--protein ligase [Enterococcus cecorum]